MSQSSFHLRLLGIFQPPLLLVRLFQLPYETPLLEDKMLNYCQAHSSSNQQSTSAGLRLELLSVLGHPGIVVLHGLELEIVIDHLMKVVVLPYDMFFMSFTVTQDQTLNLLV